MATGMPATLEKMLDELAVSRGLSKVQAVINRAGTTKPERGTILSFKPSKSSK